jgi:hypothetical protein
MKTELTFYGAMHDMFGFSKHDVINRAHQLPLTNLTEFTATLRRGTGRELLAKSSPFAIRVLSCSHNTRSLTRMWRTMALGMLNSMFLAVNNSQDSDTVFCIKARIEYIVAIIRAERPAQSNTTLL